MSLNYLLEITDEDIPESPQVYTDFPVETGCENKGPVKVSCLHRSSRHTSSSRKEVAEPKACTSRAPSSDTAISSDSENDSDSCSESIEPDEMVELNLGNVLVNQLEANFENELPGYPKGFHPVVQVPRCFAQQLFAFYIESVYQQVDVQNCVLDSIVQQDEEFVRQTYEKEKQKFEGQKEKGGLVFQVKQAGRIKNMVKEMKQYPETSSKADVNSKVTVDQLFYKRCMIEDAQAYSELRSKHKTNSDCANSLAVTSFLNEHAKKRQNSDYLDLHFLNTKEAILVVDLFIDNHLNLLIESRAGRKGHELYIITGRGAHSKGGIPKIKPLVISRLKKRNIRYDELNPGFLKIKITRNTRMTSDVP